MKLFKLGQVCKLVGGGTPSKSNAGFYNGDIPWATVRDLRSRWLEDTEHKINLSAVEQSSTNLIPAGNVVLASRVGLGKVVQLKRDTAINQDLRALVPRENSKLDSNYLYYWTLSISSQIVSAGKGATVQGVTLPFLENLEIPVPSIDTQREIVENLDSAFTEIDLLEKNIELSNEKTDQLLQSVLSTSMNYFLINEGQTDPSAKQSPTVELMKLVDICRLVGGGTPSKANSDFYLGDIPWATVRDMRSRWLENTEHKINEVAVRESSTNIIPSGNVVLASRVGLGKVIQLKQDTAINQDLRALIPRQISKLDSNYLYYWALSITPDIISAGKGATVQGVTLPFLENLVVPLPSLENQKKIVANLDSAFAEIELLRAQSKLKKEFATAIRDSLLSDAFTIEEAVG